VTIFNLGMADNINLRNPKNWEKILGNSDTVDYPIVFVHGIAGGPFFWDYTANIVSNNNYYDMRYYLEDKIYHNYIDGTPKNWIFNVSYYTLNPIKETFEGDLTNYAKRMERIIENIKKITKKDKVIIIAHSMGGLVSRKYMILNDKNWDSVYKIVTVGTPNEGVRNTIGVVGQIRDCGNKSKLISDINKGWNKKGESWKKWGVVGAVETKLWFDLKNLKGYATDLAGIGYIEISSSIPFGEWKDALKELGKERRDTEHFGFRILVDDNHLGMLKNYGVLRAVRWAVE